MSQEKISMTLEQESLMRKLRMKLRRLQTHANLNVLEGVSNEMINEISQQNNTHFPTEYRIWLNLCNGIGGAKKYSPLSFGAIYGIEPNPRLGLNMFMFLHDYPKWIDNNWIPIADDGCGNYFLLMPHVIAGENKHVIGYFEALGSKDKLYDTPSYVSSYGCLEFMNLLLLSELIEAKDFVELDVFSKFFID